MATPPSKSDLLKHFTNPLLREIFEKRVEQIIKEKKDSSHFIGGARDINNFFKELEGKAQEDYIIGIKKSLTAAMSKPKETANKSKHIDDAKLNELSQATAEEREFGKKVVFIQSLIDKNKPINEAEILKELETVPDLDPERIKSFKLAVDGIKTQSHPQPLMTKIFNTIGKYDCSAQRLLALQAFCDYVRIQNNSADGTKPFPESFEKMLYTKTDCLKQLAAVEKDLKNFDRFLKTVSERKKTFTKDQPEKESESEQQPTSPRRHTL